MTSSGAQILFASRRCTSPEGKVRLTLIDMTQGNKFEVDEEAIRMECDCRLGDCLSYENNKFKKTTILTTVVIGDVAYADNIRAKLVCHGKGWVFKTSLFSHVLCPKYLPTGDYVIRVNSLVTPEKLPSGETVFFEASNERKVHEGPPTPSYFAPIAPAIGRQTPVAPIPRSLSGTPTTPTSPADVAGSRPESRASNDGKIRGAGFPVKKFHNNRKQRGVAGNGFPVQKVENQEKKLVVGEGFAAPKKNDDVVVGAGFEMNVQRTQLLRAVVLNVIENQKTKKNTHFLWILDRQADGRFLTKDYKLQPGHFFEGTFVENKAGKWNCEKYEKQIEMPAGIGGGMDQDNKIWFSILINHFQPAGGNRRFGEATARYFGKVIEGEVECAKLSAGVNGKKVKIQRRGIGEKDYVWMVVEVLP